MLKLNKYLLCISFALSCLLSNAHSPLQSIEDVIQTLKVSINNRNAKSFSEYFDNTVDMTYGGTNSNYTRSHALIILNDFFDKNHPKSFRVDYKGIAPHSDAQYIIGTTNTENGAFRIYLYIKNKEGKQVIQEIKIAK